MRRVIMVFGFLLFFVFFINQNKALSYYDCSNYGPFAYSDGTGYCKCSYGYVMGSSFLGGPYCISIAQYCKDKYGYNATSNYLTNECKCVSGYFFGKDMFGNTSCVSGDSLCRDSYGYNSEYDSSSDKCKCRSGYSFGTDVFGNTSCVSSDSLCRDNYGINSEYNSLLDKCECRRGYEFTLKTLGGLECESCSSKYGYYSSYNSSEKKCECMSGYTLDDNSQCVKKQNNVYFRLIELDSDNNSALIKSEYDNKYYFVVYKSGCYSHSFKRYLNKQIVVNLGTDFFINKGDKIVLQDDNESCEVKSFEKVDSDFSFFEETKEGDTFNALKNTNIINNGFSNKLKGKILLQVESRGEAYYINPKDSKRYYMANGNEAYRVMRYLGVGITNADLNKIKTNKSFAKKNSGKIFLQIESRGEAYYIDSNGVAHYLKDGAAAYEVMRSLGLGITNNDLNKINEGSL